MHDQVAQLALLAAAAALLCLPMSAAADTTVKAKLVEQNGSGVSGTVTLTALDNGGLKVVIHSQGLVPGQPHAQHIHGSAHGGHFGCPTVKKNDTDGDGVLTNEEASRRVRHRLPGVDNQWWCDPARRPRRRPDAGGRLQGPS